VFLQPSVVVNGESGNLGCVISQDELILRRTGWKRNGKRVVFASGAFDLLHPGHVRLLEQARSFGDVVVVGIESDAGSRNRRVSSPELLGYGRPVTPSTERAEIIAALASVDFAVEIDSESLPSFAARLAPHAIVKGGNPGLDKAATPSEKSSASAPGKLILIPLEPGHSTARLIERIKNLNA